MWISKCLEKKKKYLFLKNDMMLIVCVCVLKKIKSTEEGFICIRNKCL